MKYLNYFLQLSNLQQQRIMVEQLRREAAIKRVNVSQAIEDIKVNQKMPLNKKSISLIITAFNFFYSLTEIHFGSRIRRLSSSRISISKVQSLQGKIILQRTLRTNDKLNQRKLIIPFNFIMEPLFPPQGKYQSHVIKSLRTFPINKKKCIFCFYDFQFIHHSLIKIIS